MSKLKTKGHLWIENNKVHLIGPGRKELLEAVHDYGSITLAAKKMKMSYRHAWEMINDMNKNSARPIVVKNPGGINGGGSSITDEGKKLIAEFIKISREFEKFKFQLNKKI